jgi:hypothetical protein
VLLLEDGFSHNYWPVVGNIRDDSWKAKATAGESNSTSAVLLAYREWNINYWLLCVLHSSFVLPLC